MFADPTFWFAVAFFIFIGMFSKKVWVTMRDGLDDRAQKIEDEVAQAIEMREEAQKLLNTIKQQHSEAELHAKSIIDHATLEAERLKSESAKELDEYMRRREKLAQERISYAEEQAIKDVKHQSIVLAVAAAKKILTIKISEDVDQHLVKKAFEALKKEKHTTH
jgi:F-type H+-transporting ATPase subunit b